MGNMARRCVFCGASGLTREHVIPQWLTSVLPEQERWRGQDQATIYPDPTAPNSAPVHRELVERFNAMTVKAVCASCNNTFMNGIEAGARPVLSTMIRGGRLSIALAPETLTKLATWAVKTGLMVQLTGQEPASLELLYQHLYRERRPSDECRVWLGQVDDEDWALRAECPTALIQMDGEEIEASDPPNVVAVTLGLGALLLHVFLPANPALGYLPDLQSTFTGLVPIWPNPSAAQWPPARITRADEAWAISMTLPLLYS